ncbi:MAG: hypothetical protein R3Y64_07720 [Peptostreptococcaceae bacterium]
MSKKDEINSVEDLKEPRSRQEEALFLIAKELRDIKELNNNNNSSNNIKVSPMMGIKIQ